MGTKRYELTESECHALCLREGQVTQKQYLESIIALVSHIILLLFG